MSYDFWLEIDTGGPDPAQVGEDSLNYTYNCSPMFTDAMGFHLGEIKGMSAAMAEAKLTAGVERMQADPEKYRAMDPPNGWGDYEGALEFLTELRDLCRRHPNATVGAWL